MLLNLTQKNNQHIKLVLNKTSTFKSNFSFEEIQNMENDYFSWLRLNPKVFDILESLWRSNFRQFGFEVIAENIFKAIEDSEGKDNEEVITLINNAFEFPEFKKFTRFARQVPEKMDINFKLLKNYIDSAESFFDFGCGRMALIRRIVRDNMVIKKFYGYDPKANPTYLDFDPRVEFFDRFEQLKNVNNIDVVYSSFVFHHLSFDQIDQNIQEILIMLKPGGKFILVEESFAEVDTINIVNNSSEKLSRLGYELHSDILQIFNKLDLKEKLLTLYLNDVLINIKNLSYMPWTFEYRTIEEWRSLIESYGFKSIDNDLFWVLKEGKIKQGVSGMMIFKKND